MDLFFQDTFQTKQSDKIFFSLKELLFLLAMRHY